MLKSSNARLRKRHFLVGLLGILFCGQVLRADTDPPTIDGTYKGSMSLFDVPGTPEIALSIALTITDAVESVEVAPGQFELVKVIDGNFLLDKEGGPFSFTKVTYRFKTSEVDLVYRRTKGVTVGQPASYRLVGKLAADGSISGVVLSGFKGQIGTFKLAKTDLKPLVSKLEYAGVWSGVLRTVPEGYAEQFGISVSPTGFASLNPESFDFDFTPGKIAQADWGIISMRFPNVAIDYLHRTIIMSDTGYLPSASILSTSITAKMDFATGHLKGSITTRGICGNFDLAKMNLGEKR